MSQRLLNTTEGRGFGSGVGVSKRAFSPGSILYSPPLTSACVQARFIGARSVSVKPVRLNSDRLVLVDVVDEAVPFFPLRNFEKN